MEVRGSEIVQEAYRARTTEKVTDGLADKIIDESTVIPNSKVSDKCAANKEVLNCRQRVEKRSLLNKRNTRLSRKSINLPRLGKE